MNLNDKCQLISAFVPARDERGNGLSYDDYRAFIGVPVTGEEIEARAALNEADRRYREATECAYRLNNRCPHHLCGRGYAHAGEHTKCEPRDHRVR